jgi:hypothetical protein
VPKKLIALEAEQLVRSTQCFLVSSGVSPHPFLRGLRIHRHHEPVHVGSTNGGHAPAHRHWETEMDKFAELRENGLAESQTVILNGAAKTIRFLDHTRNLASDYFYLRGDDGSTDLVTAKDAIAQFVHDIKRQLRSPG